MTAGTKQAETQFLTFGLDQETFAVPVAVVREILDHEELFKVPQGPGFLLGLRDVRGQGIPVIDLRLRLGMSGTQRTSQTRVIVINIELGDCEKALTLGLVADCVFEVADFSSVAIERAPDIGVRWASDYIEGVVRRNSGFVIVIDLLKLFSDAAGMPLKDAVWRQPEPA